MPEIRIARTADDLAGVVTLLRSYLAWHRVRHASHRDMIDRYFGDQDFEDELARLPGDFSPPQGRLLLATVAGQPAGTVALRDLGGGTSEMKRLFVASNFQGQGVGRYLLQRLVADASAIGYESIRLDTGPLQYEAHRLYERAGFCRISPYGTHDHALRDWLFFMELKLRRHGMEPSVPAGRAMA
ncbi:MAG: GNAT family N-acetyltransferase [Rhodobacteraceae bacterium]|nr:GNAT family N-acetyltransferase [Paracoccaceae bacterium]